MEEALGGFLRPCIESRHAYQALKSLATHKTDRSDARGFTAVLGIPTLGGLGADGKGAHAAYTAKLKHTGPEGGPVEVRAEHKIDIESLSHEQRDQLREILLAAKALATKVV
jgi:hypothetical protein